MVTLLEQTTEQIEVNKKCPYCAEQIQNDAIKCRYCGEFIEEMPKPKKAKWHQSTTAIVIAILSLGPLALPMVWFNSRYSVITRIVITVLVIGLTVGLMHLMISSYTYMLDQVNQLGL